MAFRPLFWLLFAKQTFAKLTALNIASTRQRHINKKKITHIHHWQIPSTDSSLGRIKCEINQSCFLVLLCFFCMDKNTLFPDFAAAVFDLWDIYTSNVSNSRSSWSSEQQLDPRMRSGRTVWIIHRPFGWLYCQIKCPKLEKGIQRLLGCREADRL